MNGCNCELSATAAELLRTRLCRALRSVSPSSAKSHICMEHELLVELCSWDHVHHIRTKLGMGSLRFCSRCVFCCAPEEKSKYSANTWYLNCLSAQYYPFLHLAHKLCRGLSSHAAADLFSALFLKACVCECVWKQVRMKPGQTRSRAWRGFGLTVWKLNWDFWGDLCSWWQQTMVNANKL